MADSLRLPCPTCSGTGTNTYEDRPTATRMDTCRTCGGEGEIAPRTGESAEASFSADRGAVTGGTEGLREALSEPFMTAHSGNDGFYVRLKYSTLLETQVAHTALCHFFSGRHLTAPSEFVFSQPHRSQMWEVLRRLGEKAIRSQKITDHDAASAAQREALEEIERLVFQSLARPASPGGADVEGLREALAWYGEQARLARLIHSEGDSGRHAIGADGGKRAAAALARPDHKGQAAAGVGDLDDVLFAFHRYVEVPTPFEVTWWTRHFPQFADDIRAHAVEVMDLQFRARGSEAAIPSGSVGEEAGPSSEYAAKAVARAMDEDGGWWKPCSGCHETNEGYETGHYPYSELFRCHVGAGCRGGGGLGVVWEYYSEEDFAAMAAESAATQPPAPKTPGADAARTEPLTATALADAFECFWNAALGAERGNASPAGCMAEGFQAVAVRLREVAALTAPQAARHGEGVERYRAALKPFADYAHPRRLIPASHVLTPGPAMAKRQLTMGDCYAAADALTTPDKAEAGEGRS